MFEDLDTYMSDPRFQRTAYSYANLSPEMRAVLKKTTPLDDKYQANQLTLLELGSKRDQFNQSMALKRDQLAMAGELGREKNTVNAIKNAAHNTYVNAAYGNKNSTMKDILGIGSALVAGYGAMQKSDAAEKLIKKGYGLSAFM